MPSQKRRAPITDVHVARKGLSLASIRTLQMGTRAMGAAWAGTISFKGGAFQGTPFVLLQPLSGSTAFGRTVHLRVNSRASGSFTYMGSPNHGTFSWLAVGTYVPTG